MIKLLRQNWSHFKCNNTFNYYKNHHIWNISSIKSFYKGVWFRVWGLKINFNSLNSFSKINKIHENWGCRVEKCGIIEWNYENISIVWFIHFIYDRRSIQLKDKLGYNVLWSENLIIIISMCFIILVSKLERCFQPGLVKALNS